MTSFTLTSSGAPLEDRYIGWSEVGLGTPQLSASTLYGRGSGHDPDFSTYPLQTYSSAIPWAMTAQGTDGRFAAIKTDGSLWASGDNGYGVLGLDDTVNRSSPTQVGTSSWTMIAFSDNNATAYAIRADKTLWAWGQNSGTTFGIPGITTSRSSPVQISADSWYKVAGGYFAAAAIKTDGTLWGWGDNNSGWLGKNNRTAVSSPVQLMPGKWSDIAMCDDSFYAISEAGALWVCGNNSDGHLGLNDRVARSSPVQVGTSTDWKSINTGAGGISGGPVLAIKRNGTLWSWGINTNGQLGIGDRVNRSSPVQVGAMSDWVSADSGQYVSLGIKQDGALWWWGSPSNNENFVGSGSRSSPVQVSTFTNCVQVSSTDTGSVLITRS